MQLYILLRGRSKKRLKPVMIDTQSKADTYKKALISSDPGSGKMWWYDVQPAPKDAEPWRKHNNGGLWANYNANQPPLVRNGSRA